MDENNQINTEVNQVQTEEVQPEPVQTEEPVAVPTTEPPKKNTPVVIIILIIALCALVGVGIWYFGGKKASEKKKDEPTKQEPTTPSNPTDPTEPTNPTDPTDPTEPTEPNNPTDPAGPTNPTKPTGTDKTLSCSIKETEDTGSYTMSFNFYYKNGTLTSGDSTYLFDFSGYGQQELAAVKQLKMCDTVTNQDPSVSKIFTDCKESWSNDGMLTLKFNVSLSGLNTEYDKIDIDSLNKAFTDEGMTCTIK